MEENAPLVVIVDDVLDNVRILHHALKDDGYSFAVARSGAELFSLVETRKPTLVLLDVMLPDMDGFEIMAKLREDERCKDVPVIFVTARNESEDRLRGLALGGVDYVAKPFSAPEIRARVSTHVSLRRALESERRLVEELRSALERVKKLEGIIPICARCKSVRTDNGYWKQVESYLGEYTGIIFSHGLCPDCARVLFPGNDGDGMA